MSPPFDAEAEAREAKHGAAAPEDIQRPLYRELPLTKPFPVDALGKLRDAAEAIHQHTQAPMAVCAQSVLATAALAIAPHCDVELPGPGLRPLSGLFISILESGERKTAVDRLANRPVRFVEEGLRLDHRAAQEQFVNAKEAWETARAQAKKAAKGGRSSIQDALKAVGPVPMAPASPMLVVDDFSPEALVEYLAVGRSWCGVFSDEGGRLVGGHAFNDDVRMRTGALLNTFWDGGAIRRIRITTGNAFLVGRRCSVHLMVQPVVAARLLSDGMLGDLGTLARLLVVAPETTAGTRLWREIPRDAVTALDRYTASMLDILKRLPCTRPNEPDVLDPSALRLHPDAVAVWKEFYNEVEKDLRPEGELAPIRAFGSKLAEHAGRLAALLAVYDDPDCMEVSVEAMEDGIVLAQFYASEMLRLHGTARVAVDLLRAKQLLDWWRVRSDTALPLATIYQLGPGSLRDAAAARRAVAILEDHGWVKRLKPGAEVDGKRRREAWRLVP